jgi:hypothetical protein
MWAFWYRRLSLAMSLAGACLLSAGVGLAADQPPSADAVLPPGVRAVWSLDKAYHETTATRERICINGLWRWQPASGNANDVPSGQWGYFKVPAPWPGIQDYMQSDYHTVYPNPTWAGLDLGRITGAWYQRTITVPREWAGRRLSLTLEYLNSFAAVFVDGQPVGELRFPAGELDLTTTLRPGATHVLSILVLAMPLRAVMESFTDTNAARQREGRVERRGLCGDVWIASQPVKAGLTGIKVDTSVRGGQITFRAGLRDLPADSRFKLRAAVKDETGLVAEFVSRSFTHTDITNGLFSFSAPWKAPRLWDLHTPTNQYTAEVSLLDNDSRLLDAAAPIRFGFRELWIQGRDFYLNGTRLFLSLVPLDNAQVGAALSTYEAAKESFLRLKSFGINFVYTHNYGCDPGAHLSFNDILRAADDTGVLVALSQPHFSAYEWKTADAERTNGYASHAAFYVKVAGSHPSVVAYSMSHNATGYVEDMNPLLIDGLGAPRDRWSARNAETAIRCEQIVGALDPARIVYHHSSGNLSSMYTINFYPNFVPSQELDDWFEHWSTAGVKPVLLVEYGAPFGWDWTMYRGWYKGKREFGSAAVPWEYCVAEWNAQFLGDAAYQISDREKQNLRWEAEQFRKGRGWFRWDYPYPVGDARLEELQPIQSAYTAHNWRAFRTWGLSGNSPWEHHRFWTLREGFQARRRDFPVDWETLQRPGYSPDYVDRTCRRFDLAYERSDWIASPTARALLRNNQPLLSWIAGKPEHFTAKDHTFHPGETFEKQFIVINNSRVTVAGNASWSTAPGQGNAAAEHVVVPTGNQVRVPIRVTLPPETAPGTYQLSASFLTSLGETQEDTFSYQVLPRSTAPRLSSRIAVFDPPGETTSWLQARGVRFEKVNANTDLSGFDVLLIGKAALTLDGRVPMIARVRDGLRVVVFEQTAKVLEGRLGFRIAEYGMRQLWPRLSESELLKGLTPENLRDWRGSSTLLPATLDYKPGPKYGGVPNVTWCGLEVPRLWRCGNWGNVASVLIEKPHCGDFLPILDGGYALQYSALLEYREGRGLVLFCQADVTGRTASDPAAEVLADNILRYVDVWRPVPRRTAVYVGAPAGRAWLKASGVEFESFNADTLSQDKVLVVGPGGGSELGPESAKVSRWVKAGGHVLALGLDQAEANTFLTTPVTVHNVEHSAAYFQPFSTRSLLAGVAPADVHNRDPRAVPLITGGATLYGDGVLAETQRAVFFQFPPFLVSSTAEAPGPDTFNLRRTYVRTSFALSRLLGNLGVFASTPLLSRFSDPVATPRSLSLSSDRFLQGLYLTFPVEWDDPYRYFRW